MKNHLAGTLAAAALAAFTLCATPAAQAATVTLTGWAYGSGDTVNASTPVGAYSGWAGAFGGTLSGAGALDTASFITFCIELEEHFSFSSTPMLNYRVFNGARYFQEFRGDASISERLGRLMTYAADNASLVSSAQGSTALQLAIWNLVYDSDYSLGAGGGSFRDASSYQAAASYLLAGAQSVTESRFDVFALQRFGSQDFLAVSARAETPRGDVPEPGSLALAGAALAGLVAAARRRRA